MNLIDGVGCDAAALVVTGDVDHRAAFFFSNTGVSYFGHTAQTPAIALTMATATPSHKPKRSQTVEDGFTGARGECVV